MSPTPPRAILPARRQPTRLSLRRSVQVAVGAASMVVATVVMPHAHGAESRIIVGAAGDTSALSSALGTSLAHHAYGKLDGSVPTGKMVNMKATVPWRTVASASSGSSTYNHIVRWANTLKGRPGPVLFAFHHEPEASTRLHMGTATDYIAAYRRVVTLFRQQGVSNVEYTWQMTSWAFAVNTSDRRAAHKWYPGDAYVTNVATDPYNWYNCGSGQGRWEELKTVMDPSLAFARLHGKKLVVGEFGSQSDSRRAQWLRNARQYFIANRASIRAVFYFQYEDKPGCYWRLRSSADLGAMREMARDTTNFYLG